MPLFRNWRAIYRYFIQVISFNQYWQKLGVKGVLLSVILCAFFVLTYQLDLVPVGLNQDEAVAGYDAFSLLHTGRDHHGNFLPIMFESFGDWTSPVLTYLMMPSVALFSLSVWSIRLPGGLLGAATVLLTVSITRQLQKSSWLSIIVAVFTVTSPWLMMNSRWALPTAILPFFAMLLLERAIRWQRATSPSWWLAVTLGLSAGFATHVYPTMKLFVPLFILAVSCVSYRQRWKQLAVVWVVFSIIVAPIYLSFVLFPESNARFDGISIFNQANPLSIFLKNYSDYFSPTFLFGEGDSDIGRLAPGFAALNPALLPLFWIGAALLLYALREQAHQDDQVSAGSALLLLVWIVLSPIPASLTVDPMMMNRVIHLFPVIIIVSSLAVRSLWRWTPKKYRAGSVVMAVVLLVWSGLYFAGFSTYYFGRYRQDSAVKFSAGLEEAFAYVQTHAAPTDQVLADAYVNQPYIYYLFFSRQNPRKNDYVVLDHIEKIDIFYTIRQVNNVSTVVITDELLEDAEPVHFTDAQPNTIKLFKKEQRWIIVKTY